MTTAGSAETLVASSTACKTVIIEGKEANTGKVFIGDSGVSSSDGIYIYATQQVILEIDDLQKIYLDVSVNGEGVVYTYFN